VLSFFQFIQSNDLFFFTNVLTTVVLRDVYTRSLLLLYNNDVT